MQYNTYFGADNARTSAHELIEQATEDGLDNDVDLLYLVPEPSNKYSKNALMIHTGIHKLGYVSENDARIVKAFFDFLMSKKNTDEVYVATVRCFTPINKIRYSSALKFDITGVINERSARYAAKRLKKLKGN
jgi:hypothetical protein